jgi:dienelactone hydrolase
VSEFEEVYYQDGDTALVGLVARPVRAPRGAILVFPTIANATPATERRARMLANAGYVAFLADFYGFRPEGDAAHAAAKHLRADVGAYRTRVRAALTAMDALSGTAGLPRAAIGYCMGGQAVLELARDGGHVAGVVSFHGLLQTDKPATEPGAITARILICHGDKDPLVPREAVLDFWREMDAGAANWHFHAYSGVFHGFTDPANRPGDRPGFAYDAGADRESWSAMLGFFDEIFEQPD